MNVVWPIIALSMGLFGLLVYENRSRTPSRRQQKKPLKEGQQGQMAGMGDHARHGAKKPFWQSVFISDSHCGAGCTKPTR